MKYCLKQSIKDNIKIISYLVLAGATLTIAVISVLVLVFFIMGLIVQQAQVLLFGHLVGSYSIMETGTTFAILSVLFIASGYLIVSILIDIVKFFKNTKLKDLNPFEECKN